MAQTPDAENLYVRKRQRGAPLPGVELLTTAMLALLPLLSGNSQEADGSASVPLGYRLVWSDEFNGGELDRSKWLPRAQGPRRGGIISADTVLVDGDGHLVIETRKVGSEYHAGMISTADSFTIRHGYFETRVTLPTEPGQNSALWLQSPANTSSATSTATSGTEIDVFEYFIGRLGGQASNALHWGGYGENHQSAWHRFLFPSEEAEWHTFALLWTDTGYEFFADGKRTWWTTRAVSQVPEYLILSTVIGDHANSIDETQLPDRFVIDYVRVYSADQEGRESTDAQDAP